VSHAVSHGRSFTVRDRLIVIITLSIRTPIVTSRPPPSAPSPGLKNRWGQPHTGSSPVSGTSSRIGTQSEQAGKMPIDWTNVGNCKSLRPALKSAGALTMLSLAAAHPAEWVSFQDVVQASGRNEKQVRADLGALTKAVKRIFDVSRNQTKWPAEAISSSPLGGASVPCAS
jgi:hypothetical protein